MWVLVVVNVWRMRPINNLRADCVHMTIWEVAAFPVSAFDRLKDNSTCLANWIGALVALQRKKREMNPSSLPLSPPLSSSPSHFFTPPWEILRSEWWAGNSFYFMFKVSVGCWPEADKSTLVQSKDHYHLWTVLPIPIFHQSIGKVIFWRRRGEGQVSRLLKLLMARIVWRTPLGQHHERDLKRNLQHD